MADIQNSHVLIKRHHFQWIIVGLVFVFGLTAAGFYYGGRVGVENGKVVMTPPDLTPLTSQVQIKQAPQLAQSPAPPQPAQPAPAPENDLQKLAAGQQDLAKQVSDLTGRVSAIEARLVTATPSPVSPVAAVTPPTQLQTAALPPTGMPPTPAMQQPVQLAQAQQPPQPGPVYSHPDVNLTGLPPNWHVGDVHGREKAEGCLPPHTLVVDRDHGTPIAVTPDHPKGGMNYLLKCE